VTDLDYLAAHAAARPDDVAVIDGDWTITLAEFNAMVNRYGNVLRAVGVRAGEKVLWVGQNSAEVVAVNHAARKVGAVCVPLNYRLAPDEAQYVIDNCDAVVVLFEGVAVAGECQGRGHVDGEQHQLLLHIEDLVLVGSALPATEQTFGDGVQRSEKRRQVSVRQRRHGEPALCAPFVALRGEHACDAHFPHDGLDQEVAAENLRSLS